MQIWKMGPKNLKLHGIEKNEQCLKMSAWNCVCRIIDQRIHSAWCKYRSFHKDTHLVLYSLISPEMALSDFCPPINMIWTVTWIGDSWPCCTLFCQSFSIQLFNGLVFQYCSTLNFIMIFIPPMKMILMSTYRGARWRGWKKGKRDNNACVFFAIPMTIFSRVQRMRRLQKI